MKKIIILFIGLLISAVIIGGYFFSAVIKPSSQEIKEAYFTIEQGQGVNEISQNLYEQGLINSKIIFETYIWLRNYEGNIKAGEYLINSQMSIREITNTIISVQKAVKEKTIQIIEGWNINQIAEYLENQKLSNQQEFLNEIKQVEKYAKDYDFINLNEVNYGGDDLEGFLFPDTYRVYTNATAEDIVRKMLDNFNNKLGNELRNDIAGKEWTVYKTLTLASIVEKEVATDHDRAMVADIFLRRIDEKIALQSDATINYITGKKQTRSTAQDLAINSPYNTYKYRGLTPGPICNPGLSSIKAVIYPTPNDYWYFLTTDEGDVIYSKDFEEHKANKAKYLY